MLPVHQRSKWKRPPLAWKPHPLVRSARAHPSPARSRHQKDNPQARQQQSGRRASGNAREKLRISASARAIPSTANQNTEKLAAASPGGGQWLCIVAPPFRAVGLVCMSEIKGRKCITGREAGATNHSLNVADFGICMRACKVLDCSEMEMPRMGRASSRRITPPASQRPSRPKSSARAAARAR